MNLFEYFKALTISKNPMENPILISEDETRHLASIKYNMIAPRFSWSIPHMTDARGLILDTETGDVVARPYPKFFNYGIYALQLKLVFVREPRSTSNNDIHT